MCPTCNSDMLIRAFPSLLTARTSVELEQIRAEEGEASCFYHVGKRAAETCQNCGRFICAVCTVEFDSGSWCAPCMASAANQNHALLVKGRVLYDSIALGLATLPALLGIWPVFLTGPCGLFLAISSWNRPTSIRRRHKWRSVVAICLAISEIVALIALGIVLIRIVMTSGSARRPR